MFYPGVIAAVAMLAGPPSGPGIDLTGLPRRIAREPAYATASPRYCLLVLGPEARTRIWLVLDGDRLYVDRNGNGDLTEAGEQVPLTHRFPIEDSLYAEQRQFVAGDLAEGADGPRHTGLEVTHCVPNPRFVPVQTDDRQARELLDRTPGATVAIVELRLHGRLRQVASPSFGAGPRDAPVLHFNGPLTIGLQPKWFYGWPVFTRGGTGSLLTVGIGTPGLGEGSFAHLAYDDVPRDVHPVAEIDFPPKAPGEPPIRVTVPLKQRC